MAAASFERRNYLLIYRAPRIRLSLSLPRVRHLVALRRSPAADSTASVICSSVEGHSERRARCGVCRRQAIRLGRRRRVVPVRPGDPFVRHTRTICNAEESRIMRRRVVEIELRLQTLLSRHRQLITSPSWYFCLVSCLTQYNSLLWNCSLKPVL